MQLEKTAAQPSQTPKTPGKETRRNRQAEALRRNLKRRKRLTNNNEQTKDQ